MQLSTIISQARIGELATISKQNLTDEKIVYYLNLALQNLYNYFIMDTAEAIITLSPIKFIYRFDGTDNDVLVNGNPVPTDEYMIALKVYDELGIRYKINNSTEFPSPQLTYTEKLQTVHSIYTIGQYAIQVPYPDVSKYLSVIYRKNAPIIQYIDDGTGSAVDTVVPIPNQFLEAILLYIGYRGHLAITGNPQTDNNVHYIRYKQELKELEQNGIIPIANLDNNSIEFKGFV